MTLTLKVKRLTDTAKLPTYAHDGDACFDLYADEDVLINHLNTAKISTGIGFDIPDGYCVKVYGRSGLGYKHGLSLVCGGIIDQSYKGCVFISMTMVIS